MLLSSSIMQRAFRGEFSQVLSAGVLLLLVCIIPDLGSLHVARATDSRLSFASKTTVREGALRSKRSNHFIFLRRRLAADHVVPDDVTIGTVSPDDVTVTMKRGDKAEAEGRATGNTLPSYSTDGATSSSDDRDSRERAGDSNEVSVRRSLTFASLRTQQLGRLVVERSGENDFLEAGQ
ncbi:hypothetical protein CLOM_g17450 [Closterium sp. NIES-68]|nr:hypothetical protein CLOM_g17450 [Closterium sp. NIES-68]GJP64745.1 hypothetical protein CLOP_g21698 [Closterium sp. NIES-67]